ncbi:MAG: polyphosphate polymerase domain-containing protein [bacterium]|nr:polyphosphate polymerase domain-containing protein [bacterium]
MSKELSEIKRYELKYTITEELAAQIREHIKNICTLDEHVPSGERGYIVNNLYFDTPDLRFYYDTKFRKLTRYKPRARFYGEKAIDLIWPEIKYRHASVIWKRRYCIPIEQWPELFNSEKTERKQAIIKEQLDSFDDLINWYGAQPMLHVRYFREPYVTELEEYGRVTFDRQLCCRPTHGSINLEYDEEDMLYYDDPVNSRADDSPVILEIKVETLIPIWAMELIHKFNLKQRGFSKYCYGIDSILGYNEDGRISIFDYS